jgi:hypothetical protein
MGKRAICLALVLVACGDNLKPEIEDGTTVLVLDTIAPTQVQAGDVIAVQCTLQEGDITTTVTGEIHVHDELLVTRTGGAIVARTVGMIEVACALPDRFLVDPTPAIVEIIAGPPANVVTTITPDPVIAGGIATATCTVYDGHGNLLEDVEADLQLSPDDAANTITDLTAEMIRAGQYTARCVVPGTTTNNAPFVVIPNLPAQILIALFPDMPVYPIGRNVEVTHVVTDRYGNDILDATITKTSTAITGVGPIQVISPDIFRYGGEGRYRIDAVVSPPTDDDLPVAASVELVVNSRGPAITCVDDARMIDHTPGTARTLQGEVSDVNGVASFSVNGTPVAVAADGTFSTTMPTRFGMNFVDLTATDTFGESTSKVCTFLIANRWGSASTTIDDTVSFKLTQPAIDDGSRTGPLTSLGDILHTVVNSPGLRTTLHNALLASNPLKPMSCDQTINLCPPFNCTVCLYSSEVIYLDSRLPGPNTVSLTLVSGGIRAVARIENVGVRLRVRGQVSGIPYDTTGWVNISHVEVGMTLDTAIENGQPRMSVRPGSVTASAGSISTEFSGVDGWIINNIVVPLAQGTLRNTVRDLIRNYVTSNFNTILDGLMSSLDINSLGTSFQVPRLHGGGHVTLSFGLAFSSLSTTSSRMLFGIGTRFSAPAAHAFPSLGVPMPPGTNLLDASLTSPANTAMAAHVGVFNGAFHTLWRAGYFTASIPGSTFSTGIFNDVTFDVQTRLPPVAMIGSDGVVRLHLGAIDLTFVHPAMPPDVSIRLGATARASVVLVGNDLVFGNVIVDEIFVSSEVLDMTPQEQQDLEDALRVLVQQLVDQSLNGALPALPIPSFTLPTSLSQFGLPAGAELGLRTPSLTVTPQHFVLRGQFGFL